MNVQKSFRAANKLEKQGELSAAQATYDAILQAFPTNRRARIARARLLSKVHNPPHHEVDRIAGLYVLNDWSGVVMRCHALLATYPHSELVWTFAGAAAEKLGHWDTALPAFERAASIRQTPTTCANLGAAFEALGAHDRARGWFEKAQRLDPSSQQHLLALGRTTLNAGQPDMAIAPLERHVAAAPGSADGFACLGNAHLRLGAVADARRAFETAKDLAPDRAEHHNALGVVLRTSGDLIGAHDSLKRAVALAPDLASAHQNLGHVLYDINQPGAAVACYDTALGLAPQMHATRAQKLHYQLKMCDWRAFAEFDAVACGMGLEGQAVSPFAVMALEDDPMRQRRRSERYAENWPVAPRDFAPAPHDRIRVGYFSSDLYDHATLFLLNGVLLAHDPEKIELHVYALNPPEPSAEVDRLRQVAHIYRDMHALSDAQIVQQARADGLDIAVDLKGYTRGARTGIFAAGLAPVQINFLGYPGTMGSDCMDYIVGDRVVIPPGTRAAFSENVIFMPHSYQPNDNTRQIASIDDSRVDHGLPEAALVLCCFNNPYKYAPDVFDIWMRVLRQTPDAVLWLMSGSDEVRENLGHEAAMRGVDPARLIFAPRLPQAEHLARHRHADLFLDTFNYNAHTTASDALWAGLPVVTHAGRQFAARVGASLVAAMGLSELITQDAPSYEAKIMALVANRAELSALREQLRAARGTAPLFDTYSYTRDLEAAFHSVHAARLSGEAPRDVYP